MKPKRKSNKESAATLFNRYVWLADTIRRAGRNEKKAEGGRRNEYNYELRITEPLDFLFITSYFLFLIWDFK